ncbi:MAG: 30S ribosomal protein S3 [Parcubacteria group bacterium CG08_land_8_20_14_0_20_48_21]|nr:MAG: 30S ribosomal protein S3 [Parcubacteria group bacterium CG2_30_48_51]PIS32630.1 MAG: 30S ribosomal protein S3 [Parcubacteria group bacterium CG08_land_8_20_14_0_20_48_21]PIW79293.1 MAG: 30S ribosomal protein S3 [Parcubacteria group bacterium CG_4_8_14_3_um_filter_48_16]PIY77594.1 MAG: 30S ribosomal protein S3 [Parcubacteria group bacterium CG_4_10_14_0_8_um_filter_48_154]PIZ77179.1 MAG: 30S ribosomal protein S3 [bacterium CG_4_10_14_0_2_um_filter_48_144]PJC40133.1 MAG: 30S ribosomal pr
MGQKVHPIIFRIGTTKEWPSRWFAAQDTYRAYLRQDVGIRKFLQKELVRAGIAEIGIERSAKEVKITINAAKPGMIIGRSGAGIEDIKKKMEQKFFRGSRVGLQLNVSEIKNPSLNARVVVQDIIAEIEKRVPFRRVMKQAVGRVERAGAEGVKIVVAGRLNGAEIARTEKLVVGKIPLHTLRADIDYARGVAKTIFGAIGVKVWIYKGEVFRKKKKNA